MKIFVERIVKSPITKKSRTVVEIYSPCYDRERIQPWEKFGIETVKFGHPMRELYDVWFF